MPGNPRECRLHAMRCAELAAGAKTTQLKMTLVELSKSWQKMAEQLETSQALLDEERAELKKSSSTLRLLRDG
jgi:hypothetical protein